MTRRYWIAGLAGGVAMFIWASIAHMTPALSGAGIHRITDEPLLLSELHGSLGTREGLYIYPRPGAPKAAPDRGGQNASGLILYRLHGGNGPELRQLIGEFLLELFETLLGVALLSIGAVAGFGRRVGFFAVLGVLVAMTTNGSNWLWYGFPAAFSLAAMLIEFGKFLIAGVVVALVLGRTRAPRRR